MPIDPQRWRMPLLLLLLGATATSFWWLPPLLDWVHDYGDDVQGLQALIQLVLSGMTLVLLSSSRTGRTAPPPSTPFIAPTA